MFGYIGMCKELVGRSVRGLILLVLIVPPLARAQTQVPPATDQPKRAQLPAREKHRSERAFVLVGAGDIASCKNPEGARATAKLINKSPGQFLLQATWPTKRGV